MTFTAFYLVVKDELCLTESCQSLWDQGVRRFYFCIPYTYWDDTRVNEAHVKEVTDIGNTFKAHIHRLVVPLEPGRAYQEASVRNTCMSILRGEHVLIVDADEWWRTGSIAQLIKAIEHPSVDVAACQCTTIIGVPGYPVVSKQEGLLVYLNNTARIHFTYGRSTNISPLELPQNLLYHFTATRRTREEVKIKNEISCHADEPEYKFSKWNDTILPNIKPGLENCHMYSRYQIWKRYVALRQRK